MQKKNYHNRKTEIRSKNNFDSHNIIVSIYNYYGRKEEDK